jgi:hypothetical protein
MLRHLLLALLILLCSCATRHPLSERDISSKLISMGERDQEAMSDQDEARRESLLHAQTSELKDIIAAHGWPRISVVGKEAAQAAWLVVQHSDFDRDFQREVLAMMEPLMAISEVEPKHIAYLQDRIAVGDGLPQAYGTQGRCVGAKWEPFPISQPESVDARRRSLSMEPLHMYQSVGSSLFCSSHEQ